MRHLETYGENGLSSITTTNLPSVPEGGGGGGGRGGRDRRCGVQLSSHKTPRDMKTYETWGGYERSKRTPLGMGISATGSRTSGHGPGGGPLIKQ